MPALFLKTNSNLFATIFRKLIKKGILMHVLLFFTVFTATTITAMRPATKEESLLEAVEARDDSAVEALIKTGVDLNDTEAGKKAVLRAAVNGDSAIMKKFLATTNPRIIFTQDMWQRTPISVATMNDNIACLKLLLEYINKHEDDYSQYVNHAIRLAAEYGKTEGLKVLLQQRNINIHRAIETATLYQQEECKKLLLQKRYSMYLY